MKNYPKVIFVQCEGEKGEEYFEGYENFEDLRNDGKTAVYELKGVKTRTTEIDLI